ncbi:MAG TPA: 3'-5' exonuclease [Chitinophagaceae bacterium]|nr:3'-5' exonuclease [Chitinophagaceae bacterium]
MLTPPLSNILFLDIETVAQQDSFEALSPQWQLLWKKKAEVLLRNREDETPASIYGRAAIYAEFGKVICISCGVIQGMGMDRSLILKSFCCDDEKELLAGFAEMVNKWNVGPQKFLCAHNGREFDFPYLCRRMIIHGIPLPSLLQQAGKKPWEVCYIDTMDLWKFGDFKSYTSLNLLAATLGIQTPKDDIDGSMVGDVYWKEKDMQRIVAYCQKDVVTVAQVYLKMQGEALLLPEQVEVRE